MKGMRIVFQGCMFAVLGMAPLCGSWQGIVKWEDASGWQYVDLSWAWDAGQNWKYLPEAGMWIYVFDTAEPVPENFVLIPAGTFTMGSPTSELGRSSIETQHTVTLTRAFYLQRTEVTKEQWDAVRAEGAARGYTDLPAGEKDGLKVTHYGRIRFDPPWWDWSGLRSEANKAKRSSPHELYG